MKKIVKVNNNIGVGGTYYLKKKYRLKESVKGGICLLMLGALIITFLLIQADRVERIENTGDTETKAIQVQLTR